MSTHVANDERGAVPTSLRKLLLLLASAFPYQKYVRQTNQCQLRSRVLLTRYAPFAGSHVVSWHSGWRLRR